MCRCVCLYYRVSDEVCSKCHSSTFQHNCLMNRCAVRWHDLALARCAWLSFKISAAVSILLSHSSNKVVTHPSNVGISWSKDVVRFICHYVVQRVSVYCCISVWMRWLTGLHVECDCSIMASYCSFSVKCASSSTCVGGFGVDPSWLRFSEVAGSVPAIVPDPF